jgi:hypothetical protein
MLTTGFIRFVVANMQNLQKTAALVIGGLRNSKTKSFAQELHHRARTFLILLQQTNHVLLRLFLAQGRYSISTFLLFLLSCYYLHNKHQNNQVSVRFLRMIL